MQNFSNATRAAKEAEEKAANQKASRPLTGVATLEATDIVAWLRTHTDFFLEYPELLAVLALPSESGTTISFAQRQATLLRKRNSDLFIEAGRPQYSHSYTLRRSKTRTRTLPTRWSWGDRCPEGHGPGTGASGGLCHGSSDTLPLEEISGP